MTWPQDFDRMISIELLDDDGHIDINEYEDQSFSEKLDNND